MTFYTHACGRCILALLLLIWFNGCVSNFEHVDLAPRAVGYEAPIPKAGTRVIVWGNHSMAVDNASMWFHQQGIIVLDRTKIQQGFNGKVPKLTGSAKDWASILEAGDRIGADLVTFVEVSNIKEGQKFELSQVRSSPAFSLTVEIRGVKPGTGEIVTKSKAWQTGPAQDQNVVIEDLTSRALDGAWQPAPSEVVVKVVNKEEHDLEASPMSESDSILSPQESSDQEDFMRNGSTQSVALLDPDVILEEETIQDVSLQQPPSSVISTQGASARKDLEVTPQELPTPLPFQNGTHKSHESSTPSGIASEPVLVASTVHEDTSRLHKEVDSTYLNELEPIPSPDQRSHSSSNNVAMHVASGALSILYMPIKLVYAGLGGIFGGLTYVLSAGDERAAHSIWTGSMQGDYYLTPAHLKGDTPLKFMGPSS